VAIRANQPKARVIVENFNVERFDLQAATTVQFAAAVDV
jgi:hypothetical protein